MYKLQKSTRQFKKYMAIFTDGHTVHFGDNRYPQYKDTALGLYKHLDHLDKKRRDAYYARHGTAKKHSPKWFSHKYLW